MRRATTRLDAAIISIHRRPRDIQERAAVVAWGAIMGDFRFMAMFEGDEPGWLHVGDVIYYGIYQRPMPEKSAKLFPNGRSQAVRLPSEFRFEGEEVYIRRDPETGDVILSRAPNSWDDFFALRDAGVEDAADFLVDRHDPPAQPRELFETRRKYRRR